MLFLLILVRKLGRTRCKTFDFRTRGSSFRDKMDFESLLHFSLVQHTAVVETKQSLKRYKQLRWQLPNMSSKPLIQVNTNSAVLAHRDVHPDQDRPPEANWHVNNHSLRPVTLKGYEAEVMCELV